MARRVLARDGDDPRRPALAERAERVAVDGVAAPATDTVGETPASPASSTPLAMLIVATAVAVAVVAFRRRLSAAGR